MDTYPLLDEFHETLFSTLCSIHFRFQTRRLVARPLHEQQPQRLHVRARRHAPVQLLPDVLVLVEGIRGNEEDSHDDKAKALNR